MLVYVVPLFLFLHLAPSLTIALSTATTNPLLRLQKRHRPTLRPTANRYTDTAHVRKYASERPHTVPPGVRRSSSSPSYISRQSRIFDRTHETNPSFANMTSVTATTITTTIGGVRTPLNLTTGLFGLDGRKRGTESTATMRTRSKIQRKTVRGLQTTGLPWEQDGANSCVFAHDSFCDVPRNCKQGTDSADCHGTRQPRHPTMRPPTRPQLTLTIRPSIHQQFHSRERPLTYSPASSTSQPPSTPQHSTSITQSASPVTSQSVPRRSTFDRATSTYTVETQIHGPSKNRTSSDQLHTITTSSQWERTDSANPLSTTRAVTDSNSARTTQASQVVPVMALTLVVTVVLLVIIITTVVVIVLINKRCGRWHKLSKLEPNDVNGCQENH